jgi:PAS domain-containing protein
MQDTQTPRPPDRKIRLLFVGDGEVGVTRLRDLLIRDADVRLHLDHAHSLEEAFPQLENAEYDLVLCDYKSSDEAARLWVHQAERNAPHPVIFLRDSINDAGVEALLQTVACDCMSGCNRAGTCMALPILSAIHVFCRQSQHRNSDEMLRKLRCTVEQSPDLVMITDSSGVLEYVNPAFESLTGYPGKK